VRKWLKITLIVMAAIVVIGAVALFLAMRPQGIAMVTYPLEERELPTELPSDYGLAYEEVTITTADGLKLVGWFVPSQKGVTHFTGLPPFPFAPLITFWAERTADIRAKDIDSTKWIGQISPRPVFIMMGGAGDHISIDSGQKLYDAAGEPKELWFEPTAGHHGLPEVAPEEYERRVAGFFDQYLQGE
jgi:hypothetical protein